MLPGGRRSNPEDGIDQVIYKRLVSRKSSDDKVGTDWYLVWKALFPGDNDTQIPSSGTYIHICSILKPPQYYH